MLLLPPPEPSGKERSRATPRRWVLPPAPGSSVREFEGWRVLEEAEDPIAFPLFAALRDLVLWTATSPGERKGLFRNPYRASNVQSPEIVDLQLRDPILVVLRVGQALQVPSKRELSRACSEISEWAAERGYLDTSIAFAEAASAVAPADADLAYRAGRAARRKGAHDRAQQWFELTIALARRSNDPTTYTSAQLGWGVMETERGRRDAARKRLTAAWKAAKRWKLRRLAAAARHNLMILEIPDGDLALAGQHASASFRLYGRSDEKLYRLANDTACLWASRSFLGPALEVFEAALPFFTRIGERALVIANIGRAAAALGDRTKFLDACDEVIRIGRATGERLAVSLVTLAHGAITLGYTGRARALATDAVVHARRTNDPVSERQGADVLEELVVGPRPDVPRPPPEEVQILAREFVSALTKRTGPQ
jgi:tetratricopeptide (TPR) repeat protein